VADDLAAEAVANQHRPLQLELKDDRVQIRDEVRQGVDTGLAAVAVAAQVEGNDPIAVAEPIRHRLERQRQILHPVQQNERRRALVAVVVDLQFDTARTREAETPGLG